MQWLFFTVIYLPLLLCTLFFLRFLNRNLGKILVPGLFCLIYLRSHTCHAALRPGGIKDALSLELNRSRYNVSSHYPGHTLLGHEVYSEYKADK